MEWHFCGSTYAPPRDAERFSFLENSRLPSRRNFQRLRPRSHVHVAIVQRDLANSQTKIVRTDAYVVSSNFGPCALFGSKDYCAALKNGCDEPIFMIHAERAIFRERKLNLAELKTHNALEFRFDAVAVINSRTRRGIIAVQARICGLKDDTRRRRLRLQGACG